MERKLRSLQDSSAAELGLIPNGFVETEFQGQVEVGGGYGLVALRNNGGDFSRGQKGATKVRGENGGRVSQGRG